MVLLLVGEGAGVGDGPLGCCGILQETTNLIPFSPEITLYLPG